jgi:D-inositol-3-phosphate glycosyltransferase
VDGVQERERLLHSGSSAHCSETEHPQWGIQSILNSSYQPQMSEQMKVTLLAGGGGDVYYELGLCSGLVSAGIHVNYIGSDSMSNAKILRNENVTFLNLRGSQDPNVPRKEKGLRIARYYLRLIKYAWETDSKLFHIQWPNRFVYFDRTILNLYYKMLRKKLIFTAHNVNAGVRDGNDSVFNRLTLRFMYKMMNHIIVHTDKMKEQLLDGFEIEPGKVTVLPFGVNNVVFQSDLTPKEAKEKLGLGNDEKTMLFFGIITSYKGMEYLLRALVLCREKLAPLRLIIAGKIDQNAKQYWEDMQGIINKYNLAECLVSKIGYIPDEDLEVYFKAADVLVLPYKYIFQSGVLFLSYNFGLPVIATDVGSLRDFIVEGKTGFVCMPEDPEDLAKKIAQYYASDLYRNLESSRVEIINLAKEKYSWERIGEKTCAVYSSLMNLRGAGRHTIS